MENESFDFVEPAKPSHPWYRFWIQNVNEFLIKKNKSEIFAICYQIPLSDISKIIDRLDSPSCLLTQWPCSRRR